MIEELKYKGSERRLANYHHPYHRHVVSPGGGGGKTAPSKGPRVVTVFPDCICPLCCLALRLYPRIQKNLLECNRNAPTLVSHCPIKYIHSVEEFFSCSWRKI